MSEPPKFKMVGIWQLIFSMEEKLACNFQCFPNQAGKFSLLPADNEFNPVTFNSLTLNEVPCLGYLLKLGFTPRPYVIHR